MPAKVVLIADPGIDTAFAISLALLDRHLEVLGLLATAGNVTAEQATQNIHLLIDRLDPPKWPRLGAAVPVRFEIERADLHGPGGLGGVRFPSVSLHNPLSADKLLVELAKTHPHEITLIVLGPLTTMALALDRDHELVDLLHRVVIVGGAWHEPGNAGPVTEFHIGCDPDSARQVLRSSAPMTLIPLDASRKLVLSPTDLLELPSPDSPACQFLRQIVPYGIRSTANLYGVEGFHLKDVLGVVAVARPRLLTTRAAHVDIEQRGELTRGMTVVDVRANPANRSNVDLVTGVDVAGARDYVREILGGGL